MSRVSTMFQQLSVLAVLFLCTACADNFYQDTTSTFGDHRVQILDGGSRLSLSLDKISGSGVQSKNEFLFGRFDVQLKLVPGNSAGTVTTFYLSSQGAGHDEIDFEFLGNSSGQPYTIHTNVYSQGKGDKEQQFRLWFDPTTTFHTYSIVWNARHIMSQASLGVGRLRKEEKEKAFGLLQNNANKSSSFLAQCPPCTLLYKETMSSISQSRMSVRILVTVVVMAYFGVASGGNFLKDVNIIWGNERCKIQDGGQLLTLSLDKYSGSSFESKAEYLFGRFDVQLKLVPGNSAGTVTTFFLSSQGTTHDEIDYEFLGNASGQPYTVHTNVYAQGKGNKEQQFRLWFDPTASFHTYSIIWNSKHIIFLVDNIPLRVINNNEDMGVPFPKNQAMKVYASLWNADDWATQGGRVKTDWTKAPFVASYKNFNANGCIYSASGSSCGGSSTNNDQTWQTQQINDKSRRWVRWARKYHMIYDYCHDLKRFPQGLPPEC